MLNILERYDLKADGPGSPRTLHRVAEAMRLHLADKAHLAGFRQFGEEFIEDGGLLLGGELRFQLDLVVEIVLDSPLGAAGHKDKMLDSGRARFGDDIG